MAWQMLQSRQSRTIEEKMKTKNAVKLTPAEARRLEQFVNDSGGQVRASILLGVAPSTLSRNTNRRTAPSPLLRKNLVEAGIVKPQ
jgi:hypothetical protein